MLRAGFVQGVSSGQSRPVKVCARVMEESFGGPLTPDSDGRSLTNEIKRTKSLNELMSLLNIATERTLFNRFHASTAYHKLDRLAKKRRFSKEHGMVLAKLHSRVLRLLEEGELDEQGLTNVMWGLAKLHDTGPEASKLIRASASAISEQASGMSSRQLSNCLWAAAQLQDLEPSTGKMVPPIVAEISGKGNQLSLRDLANNFDALVTLQDSVAEVGPLLAPEHNESFLREAADRMSGLLPELEGKDLYMNMPSVIWACARSGLHDHQLFVLVAKRFKSQAAVSLLPDWDLCALAWSYQVVDPNRSFDNFQDVLKIELDKRSFSASKVEGSKVGPSLWGRPTG